MTDQFYELPVPLRDRPDGSCLIYVSLGTIGCTVVDLLQRLIDVLSRTAHRFIISKGPYGDQLKLPNTMVGETFLPQTKVLPLVDLVITHGGNNTVTEVLYFGKPMILLTMFWDQHDNAQRMHEMGFGVRLDTYHFTDEDLLTAVDTLLKDDALRNRMAHLGEQICQRDGLRTAVDIIERVADENLIY
jgi:UDP:flavonoid glycosyltransferase YjiC (YdhE family)